MGKTMLRHNHAVLLIVLMLFSLPACECSRNEAPRISIGQDVHEGPLSIRLDSVAVDERGPTRVNGKDVTPLTAMLTTTYNGPGQYELELVVLQQQVAGMKHTSVHAPSGGVVLLPAQGFRSSLQLYRDSRGVTAFGLFAKGKNGDIHNFGTYVLSR